MIQPKIGNIISRNVVLLSIVSLCTDVASEMLYPVMPVYLKSIGFSVMAIGILEGIAEATAGLSKGYFGQLSDVKGRRLPFVQIGYALSAAAKPMLAMSVYPLWVFLSRTMDRLGKGIRTSARDAMLSDEATPATKARVFGFHRAMDTTGAMIGPTFAMALLYFLPEHYKMLFLVAFIPGLLAVATTMLLKEQKKLKAAPGTRVHFVQFISYWKRAPDLYRRLVIPLLLFALLNSSDMFLLLKMKEVVHSDVQVILVYILYNMVYALFAYPAGMMADRLGMKKTLITGFLLFSVTYFGMAVSNNLIVCYLLFVFYGLYAAATEGIAKAWISNISQREDTATAIGTYTAFQSVASLIASAGAGVVWLLFGPVTLFGISGCVAVGVALNLSLIRIQKTT